MQSPDPLTNFIASSFRTVWALELLLLLKREGRPCSTEQLVASLRASSAVIDRALQALTAAGLAGHDGPGVAYMPVNSETASLVEQTERLYGSHPNRVRRLIVASSSSSLVAFSDAFRLKD